MVRVHATTSAGRFGRGPLQVGSAWQEVDATQPGVRDALLASVGVHIAVHPHDVSKLAAGGLVMSGGRLAERSAPGGPPAPPAPPVPPAPAPAPVAAAQTGESAPPPADEPAPRRMVRRRT